jgi:hypothetical protein
MKKLFALCILSIFMASCSMMGKSGDVGVSAGQISKDSNENSVGVYKNSFMTSADTYEIALKHCAKFKKTPKLVRAAKMFDLWMKDQYACVTN